MSEKYEATGQIINIGETQSFASGFTKRVFVVETPDPKYPQTIPFEAVKERCDALDSFSVGENVKVSFNLKGNEYNGKYYVSLQAWKIEREGQQAQPQQRAQSAGPKTGHQNGAPPPGPTSDDEFDSVPF